MSLLLECIPLYLNMREYQYFDFIVFIDEDTDLLAQNARYITILCADLTSFSLFQQQIITHRGLIELSVYQIFAREKISNTRMRLPIFT